MKIKDVSPEGLADVDDKELLSLHLRTHQLYGANFGADAPPGRGYQDDKKTDVVDGLRFDEAAAKALASGDAKLARLATRLGNRARPFFLVSPRFVYGIIRLGEPKGDTTDYPVEYVRAFKVPLTYTATGTGAVVQQVEITAEEKPLSLEDLVHAHLYIVAEMTERKVNHQHASELDDEKLPSAKSFDGFADRELSYYAAADEYYEADEEEMTDVDTTEAG